MALNFCNNNSLSAITALPASISGGGLNLISTQTASSSSSLSFTSGIDSTYKEYIFKCINIHPGTDQSQLRINFSTDGGSNYNVTKTTTHLMAYNNEAGTSDYDLENSVAMDSAQSTNPQLLSEFGMGGDDDECGVALIHLYDPSNTTFVKHFITTTRGMGYASDRYTTTNYISGYCNTTSAVNAVQFTMSSGNIDSGVIKLYGVS